MKAAEQALPLAPRTGLRRLAELLKALADETRLYILTMLREGEMCVCEIRGLAPIPAGHFPPLKNLKAGLVTNRREGKWIYYDLDLVRLERILTFLKDAGPRLAGCREADGGRYRPRRCNND